MNVVRTIADLRRALESRSFTLGLVPTMGALHDGHRALFRAARDECEAVVATIFVNPRQFNDASDLAAYPRQESSDLEMAAMEGVDIVFTPSADEIYPRSHATSIDIKGAALESEGAHRPGHFNGVALVCLKLFNIVEPDVAYFGQKDAQQVAVIKQLVRDLDIDLEIRVIPTVRDKDGLALSSRNVRLSPADRARALSIPRALRAALDAHARGSDPVKPARDALSGVEIDYVAVASFDGEPTLVVAARVGATRLIDNVPLNHPELAGL